MGLVKLLDSGDRDQFLELIDRRFHAKELKSKDSDQKFLAALDRSGKSLTRIYGYFNDENELLSATCQDLWNQVPFYTMSWGLIHPKFSTGLFSKSIELSGLRMTFDAALIYAESVNRFQFFYGMTLRNFKIRREIWKREDSHFLKNYQYSIETIVPKGTVPEFEPWKYIIGHQSRQEDIVIKSCRLKPELIFNKLNMQEKLGGPYEEIYGK